MKKTNFFNRHLVENGENFFEHFLFSFAIACWLFVTVLVLICHAIFPSVFSFTASRNVKKINEVMQKRIAFVSERKKIAQEEDNLH